MMSEEPSFPDLHRLLTGPVDPAIAWIFPGQGSQQVGMGLDLYESSSRARALFQWADRLFLSVPMLSELIFRGPADQLRQTINAQPAIFVTSLACLSVALDAGVLRRAPAFIAGHSLGEYTAMVAATAVDPATGFVLVRERGSLMQETGRQVPGALTAIVGLDEEAVWDLCKESNCEVANVNSPGQIVIGGRSGDVERAGNLAVSRGGRSLPLEVSGAFHTSLMRPAADGLRKVVEAVRIQSPIVPVIGNSSAEPIRSVEQVEEELEWQMISPVLWRQSVDRMLQAGVTRFFEIGPGRVLASLIKRIDRGISVANLGSLATIRELSHVGLQR